MQLGSSVQLGSSPQLAASASQHGSSVQLGNSAQLAASASQHGSSVQLAASTLRRSSAPQPGSSALADSVPQLGGSRQHSDAPQHGSSYLPANSASQYDSSAQLADIAPQLRGLAPLANSALWLDSSARLSAPAILALNAAWLGSTAPPVDDLQRHSSSSLLANGAPQHDSPVSAVARSNSQQLGDDSARQLGPSSQLGRAPQRTDTAPHGSAYPDGAQLGSARADSTQRAELLDGTGLVYPQLDCASWRPDTSQPADLQIGGSLLGSSPLACAAIDNSMRRQDANSPQQLEESRLGSSPQPSGLQQLGILPQPSRLRQIGSPQQPAPGPNPTIEQGGRFSVLSLRLCSMAGLIGALLASAWCAIATLTRMTSQPPCGSLRTPYALVMLVLLSALNQPAAAASSGQLATLPTACLLKLCGSLVPHSQLAQQPFVSRQRRSPRQPKVSDAPLDNSTSSGQLDALQLGPQQLDSTLQAGATQHGSQPQLNGSQQPRPPQLDGPPQLGRLRLLGSQQLDSPQQLNLRLPNFPVQPHVLLPGASLQLCALPSGSPPPFGALPQSLGTSPQPLGTSPLLSTSPPPIGASPLLSASPQSLGTSPQLLGTSPLLSASPPPVGAPPLLSAQSQLLGVPLQLGALPLQSKRAAAKWHMDAAPRHAMCGIATQRSVAARRIRAPPLGAPLPPLRLAVTTARCIIASSFWCDGTAAAHCGRTARAIASHAAARESGHVRPCPLGFSSHFGCDPSTLEQGGASGFGAIGLSPDVPSAERHHTSYTSHACFSIHHPRATVDLWDRVRTCV